MTVEDFQKAILVPPFKQGYSLMFSSLDFFVFFKRIVIIYERFVIAKTLITEKLAEDLSNRSLLDHILKEVGPS